MLLQDNLKCAAVPKEKDRNREVCEDLSVLPVESVKGKNHKIT